MTILELFMDKIVNPVEKGISSFFDREPAPPPIPERKPLGPGRMALPPPPKPFEIPKTIPNIQTEKTPEIDINSQITRIFNREGGDKYTEKEGDVPTKWGITLPTLQEYRGKPTTIEDLKNLKEDEAREIYKNYIESAGFDSIITPRLRDTVIDHGVNAGVKPATTILQKMLKDKGYDPGELDGIMGTDTAIALDNAIIKEGEDSLFKEYNNRRRKFYRAIAKARPEKEKFLKGWLNRVNKIQKGEPDV